MLSNAQRVERGDANDNYDHDPDHDHDDATAAAEAEADEEAQLLPIEETELEFEFEDSSQGELDRPRRRPRFRWCRVRVPVHRPRAPHPQAIRPFFPSTQEAPLLLLNRLLPKKKSNTGKYKTALLGGWVLLWAVAFLGFLSAQLPVKDGAGQAVVNVDCADSLWRRKNECGIDGIDCRPFSNQTFAFRCPAKCRDVRVLNPRAVGLLDVNYRPLVIGDNPYRADSFICGSAIHAGIVSDAAGGCGRLTLLGQRDSFPASRKHGIESIPFDSYFPSSFSVAQDQSFRCKGDPRRGLLILSLFFTIMISLFSASPSQFFVIFIIIFAHVSFASDPPSASYRNITVLPDHISMFAKRLLPALFCAVVIYGTCVKRTLQGLKAQVEKTVLWLGGFWFGALSNYTFDWIPISRLTAHDLEQQPGAKLALAVILIILVCIIFQQVYYFWLEGRLGRYLALYGLFVAGILFCLTIPGVLLRIHHYILALLLLPGTSMQTRPSLLYQGILLGLFVNGIARWDFDSILQTANALRGDAALNSKLPSIKDLKINHNPGNASLTIRLNTPPTGMHGLSTLVNDVERARTFFTHGNATLESEFEWLWSLTPRFSEYFRFAYVRDGRTLDYTKAVAHFANGTLFSPNRTQG
ncbi:hypothetical protein CC78DRAFT_347690 [Lojkania enalia]|uniref:LCCL domain-containing protein n=1 Tax=Lojkania enalia TaxID=147567 RepID=A0A9P4K8R6_9PLEO|nr:hypothetical protein CC78DRAFT_347690 [Didymosphaeria enalia]